jgi:hypothetical protein
LYYDYLYMILQEVRRLIPDRSWGIIVKDVELTVHLEVLRPTSYGPVTIIREEKNITEAAARKIFSEWKEKRPMMDQPPYYGDSYMQWTISEVISSSAGYGQIKTVVSRQVEITRDWNEVDQLAYSDIGGPVYDEDDEDDEDSDYQEDDEEYYEEGDPGDY